MLDLIIVGAGPAGVSAALYAKARGLDLILFEKDQVGGLIARVSQVSHYTSCISGETGPEFAERLVNQVTAAGITLKFEEVSEVIRQDDSFRITTDAHSYQCRKLIWAAGSTPKDLGLPAGQSSFVQHWPFGQEDAVRGKLVVMNGGSDGAAKEALYLAKFAREVHIVQDQEKLLCIPEFKVQIESNPQIHVHCSNRLLGLETAGEQVVAVTMLDNSGSVSCLKAEDGIQVFALIGQAGNAGPLTHLLSTETGFIDNGPGVTTDIPGLFLAGDIRVKSVKQVATAVYDGCLAGIAAARP